jgi:RNA polymerase sigma-70 factor (ECF subfamily)
VGDSAEFPSYVERLPMTELAPDRAVPTAGPELDARLESHRIELTGYCYRMLGSAFEADDAVQETLVRAWKAIDRFEGRSSLRSWLYKIATNVCFDLLEGRQRRALPMDMGPAQVADASLLGTPLPDAAWLQPVPEARVVPSQADPATIAELRDTIRLAFVATLQLLPPNQRAVLILREVLQWPAAEVAELLGTSVASVNSALQRARATLASADTSSTSPSAADLDEQQQDLLRRYVEAFESYDMDRLTALLTEDASWSMPPYALWLQTHEDIRTWCLGPGIGCQGSRLVPVQANGAAAYAQYKPDPGGGHSAWSLQVLDVTGDRITGIIFFLDVEAIYPLFGLPLHLDD